MISKNKTKLIQSLSRKKNREQSGLFWAEGKRLVDQLRQFNFNFHTIIALPEQINNYSEINCEKIEAGFDEIKKLSLLKSPPEVLAICYQKPAVLSTVLPKQELVIALDDVQDPGNLGTIIRLASWFGIKHIVCSENSADCYNPKVIQSTMGAIANVSVHYTNLVSFLENARCEDLSIYGTFLDGKNIYETPLDKNGIIVMGNEGKGISEPIASLIDKKLLIPSFAESHSQVESLNVSMATSIICSEFKRRK